MPQREPTLTPTQHDLIVRTAHSLKPSVWADLFGVSVWRVQSIRAAHARRGTPRKRYTFDEVGEIKRLLTVPHTISQISTFVGAPHDFIARVRRGELHRNVPFPNGKRGALREAYGPRRFRQITLALYRLRSRS